MFGAKKPESYFLRMIFGVIGLVLAGFGFAPFEAAAEGFQTDAPIAYLYEPDSGTILYEKDADKPFQPGSLTKVMTAATVFAALSEGEIFSYTMCKVSEHAWRTGGAPSGGTTMFAAIKSEISVYDLLQGLLVHSGNDSAIILAECLDGSEEAFAERMNALAKEIGMTNSQFVNPTGYDSDQAHTTARDLSALADYILRRQKGFYGLFSQGEFTWNKIYQRNKNPLLGEIRNLDGLGAGSSETDGFSALGSVERNGRRVIAVVAGLPSDKARLAALKEVVEGAWEYYGLKMLYDKGDIVTQAKVFGGSQSHVPLIAPKQIDVLLPRGETLEYKLRVIYQGPLKAPVSEGVTVGELQVIGTIGVVYSTSLQTGGSVPVGSMEAKALDGLIELLFGWF